MSLPVIPSQLPAGFCPADYQEMLNGFSAHQSVTLSPTDPGGISVSSAKPTDQTRPWLKLDSTGNPERTYVFAGGTWISLHTLVPGLTQWWFDVLPNFTLFDGGDNLTAIPTDTTGPMWQQAKNSDGVQIAARFPVTAGTLPSTIVLAQGNTGGEEKHLLTVPELPILHLYPNPFVGATFGVGGSISGGGIDEGQIKPFPTQTDVGADTPHNNMPPYVVGYLLQRTIRRYYTVP